VTKNVFYFKFQLRGKEGNSEEEDGGKRCLRQTLWRIKVTSDFYVLLPLLLYFISLPPHPLFCLSSEPKLSPSL
jgi:hypothetical protein